MVFAAFFILEKPAAGSPACTKGHTYLMVVVDHDARRLVWAAPGRDKATLAGFFDLLGPERARPPHLRW